MNTRYARQELIEGWNQSTITSARVLVVGAGTTGNEVIKNLALLGFGHITIIDLDSIEEVNLSRSILFRHSDISQSKAIVAAEATRVLNPDLDTVGLDLNIITQYGNLEYRQFDCVVLTVDNLEARMWVNRYCWLCQTPLIDTGVLGLNGNVAVYFAPDTSCLECSWSQSQYENIAEKFSCLKVGIDSLEPKVPMVISSAAVIGGVAAQEVVRCVAEPGNREHRYIKYSGEGSALMSFTVPKSDQCAGHTAMEIPSDWSDIRYIDLSADIDNFVQRLKDETKAETVQIRLDKELVTQVTCRACASVTECTPTWLTDFRRTFCRECGGPVVPFEAAFTLPQTGSFREYQLPPNHLLSVYYEADGEISELWIGLRP